MGKINVEIPRAFTAGGAWREVGVDGENFQTVASAVLVLSSADLPAIASRRGHAGTPNWHVHVE